MAEKKTRVAAYCRVSTEKEEQLLSLEKQKEVFTDYAKNNNYELVKLYADEGISGTKLKNRTAFLQMMADARRGMFEKVFVKDVSRLSRNTLDFLVTLRELKALNVELVFLNSNMTSMDGELMLTIMAGIAQEESGNLSKRVKFGKKKNAEKGKVPNIVYGYDKVKGELFSLRVNEKEAEVIRYIYDLYLRHDYGANKIAKILNAKGLQTKRGCRWTQNAICRILTNPLYTGKVINGKEEVKDFLTGTRAKKKEEDWMITQNQDLRIISDEDFEASTALMEKRNRDFNLNRTRQSNRYPFSTLIKCQDCGHSFRRVYRKFKNSEYVKWVCSGVNSYGKEFCSNRTIIDEAELLEQIRSYLIHIIKDKDKFLADTKAEIRKKYQQKTPDLSVEDIQREIDRLKKMRQKQIEMFEADVINIKELKEHTKKLDKELNEYQKQLDFCYSPDNDEALTKLINTYCRDIETLLTAETMDNVLLKRIIERIEVSSEGEIKVILKIGSQL